MQNCEETLAASPEETQRKRGKGLSSRDLRGLLLMSASSVVLVAVTVLLSCAPCYSVSLNGHSVVYVSETEIYEKAVTQAQARASAILGYPYAFDQEALDLHASMAPKSNIQKLSGATTSLMDSIEQLSHVYVLTANGVTVGAAESPEIWEEAIRQVEQPYLTDNTLSVEVGCPLRTSYVFRPAWEGTLTEEQAVQALETLEPRTFPYTVQEGDDPAKIAENFSMTLVRLQELNPYYDMGAYLMADLEMAVARANANADVLGIHPAEEGDEDRGVVTLQDLILAESNPLTPGCVLTVEQSCPLLEVVTTEEETIQREIIPPKETQPDPTLYVGQERILQEGLAGSETVVANVTRRCGVMIASEDISVERTQEPTPLIVAAGTRSTPSLPKGCLFQWPTQGQISSDFGYRYIFGETNLHRGVDIAAPMNAAITAAADGTVTFTGVRGTYGNLVIIAHAGGFYTYYAHCSGFFVKPGDTVTMGQLIAAVGSTGRSTGPHCHFEVRYGGNVIDPLQYLPGANNAPYRAVPIELIPPEEEPEEEPAEEVPEEELLPEEPEEAPEENPEETTTPSDEESYPSFWVEESYPVTQPETPSAPSEEPALPSEEQISPSQQNAPDAQWGVTLGKSLLREGSLSRPFRQ